VFVPAKAVTVPSDELDEVAPFEEEVLAEEADDELVDAALAADLDEEEEEPPATATLT